MKLFFSALWSYCFILVAVIGCDPEMNMMKPAIQDVIDSKPEDKPGIEMPSSEPVAEVKQDEATMKPAIPEPNMTEDIAKALDDPSSEPAAEVKQDVEMMEGTVPEPNVEVLPVSVEDPLAGFSDIVEGTLEKPIDPYVPLEGLVVSDGRVQFLLFSAGQCINLGGANLNGVTYNAHYSKWQRREDTTGPWTDIPGTENDGGLCSYSPTGPGQYRLVCEVSIGGVRGKYASENILTVE